LFHCSELLVCGIWVPVHAPGTKTGRSRFFRMRIREENCNLILLAGVTLVSSVIAGAAALLEPTSAASKSRPVDAVAAAPSPSANAAATSPAAERKPVRPLDQIRVVGAPFVPNTNPRER
jgi:hypothetical protein